MAKRVRLLTFNDPQAMRINGELAAEIGFNESIVLLQIEFLLSAFGQLKDGRMWLRIKLSELHQKYFHWWSEPTLSRVMTRLVEAGYLDSANFNKLRQDRTAWYALNYDGIRTLSSVHLLVDEPDAPPEPTPDTTFQNENCPPTKPTDDTQPNCEMQVANDQNDQVQPVKMEHATDQNDRMLKEEESFNKTSFKESSSPQTDTSEISDDGDDGALSDFVLWLKRDIGLVTAERFAHYPETATRAYIAKLQRGGANERMIVCDLAKPSTLQMLQREAKPEASPTLNDDPRRPDWIALETWRNLTEPQRDALQHAQLVNGKIQAKYADWTDEIYRRWSPMAQRLVQGATR